MAEKWFYRKLDSGPLPTLYRLPRSIIFSVLLIALGTVLAQADDPNKVGLVVVRGSGEVIQQCVEFSDDEISGYELLERSGLDFNADVGSGLGAAVCRIDNEGCTYPEEDCFCQCQGTPCVFWIYWHLVDGDWQFSQLGAASHNLKDGDVDGWIWGEGSPQSGGVRPPPASFEEICGRSSKYATATLTPTSTPTPTNTPQPTNTPEPTDPPEPEPTPSIEFFNADRTTINVGESVKLSWDLSGADAVYLRYNGTEEGVIAPGSKTVSPTATTVYTLVARNDDSEAVTELTITVNSTSEASVTTTQPANEQPAQPTNTPIPVLPANTPTPGEPIISFGSASTVLPRGACTNLSWLVQDADRVYLAGTEVGLQGSQAVCPPQTQVYHLTAAFPGGERTVEIMLEVVEAVVAVTDTPASTVLAGAAPAPTPAQPTEPPVAATEISQNTCPTFQSQPIRRNVSPAPEKNDVGGLSFGARLGIWGGLVGGWCLIAVIAVTVWGGFWWLSSRQTKN